MTENVSTDLKSFARCVSLHIHKGFPRLISYTRHAGRSTISTDDVMLLSRRNEGLETVLRSYMDKQNIGSSKRKKRG